MYLGLKDNSIIVLYNFRVNYSSVLSKFADSAFRLYFSAIDMSDIKQKIMLSINFIIFVVK